MSDAYQNADALKRATIYSQTILDEIRDNNLLSEGIHRDLSEFTDGDSIKVPTMGEVVLRDVEDDTDIPTDSVDTGSISLEINRFRGGAHYVTDKDKEDNFLMSQLEAAIPTKMMDAIKENYETDLLAQANKQTNGDVNAINGFAHRYVASGTNQTLTFEDIIYAKTSFAKANLTEGLIMVVDPIVEATLNKLTNIVNVSNNPKFEGILNTGFMTNNNFLYNLYGFDVYVSNRLPTVTAETVDGTASTVATPSGSATVADGITTQFMCVKDDLTMPYMGAWRRQPKVEYYRNPSKEQDVYQLTSRWGFGLQRPQSLISVLTNRVEY